MRLLAIIAAVSLLFTTSGFAEDEELSLEQQRRIIEEFMYATGQKVPLSASAAQEDDQPVGRIKCGTPAILRYYRNLDRLDSHLIHSLGAQDMARPQLDYYYDSPRGWIRIHYDKLGTNRVWQADVDTDGDGTPDYVEALGRIADSCYNHMINVLRYPLPAADSACLGGEDNRIDVYLMSLYLGYYGLTYPQYDCATDSIHTPSWVVIDHDFQHLPEYVGRPLDAARVTLAHELFHTVHFTLDASEAIAWFEMTAVWMEEEQYDDINDYYTYDTLFFSYPERSIQDTLNNHHYQCMIWPLYLSEKYGVDIIKAIWMEAGALGRGQQYLAAADLKVDSASGHTANIVSAHAEFALWNFFTGPYAQQAPNGIGFSEAEYYSSIPLDRMDLHRTYPVTVPSGYNTHRPQPNGASYLRLENLESLLTYYWECADTDSVGNCVDSVEVLDTALSAFVYGNDINAGAWGVSAVYQMKNDPDSHFVNTVYVSDWGSGGFLHDLVGVPVDTGDGDTVRIIDVRDYRSVTFIFTPTTVNPYLYSGTAVVNLGYNIGDTSAVDPALANVPAAVLTPYPNPAVINEMGGAQLTFRFQAPTDETSYPTYSQALLLVDLYNVAGEYVSTVSGMFTGDDRTGTHRYGIYEAGWDMKNSAGKDVASGVYVAYARLYEGQDKNELLAEDHVKVAVIR